MIFFQWRPFLFFICILLFFVEGEERKLSRKKRYVVFPEGSSFSIALCMTIHTLTPDNIFTEGLNWGISYDLPNESKPALEPFLELRKDKIKDYQFYDKNNPYENLSGWNYDKKYNTPMTYRPKKKYYKPNYNYLRRRHRRDLYSKMEVIMNAMNFDGRACILKALCEASQRLMPKGKTLVEEITRIAFTLPLEKILSHEPEEHRIYTEAHRAGYDGHDCGAIFSSCTFSLIDMALGKYDEPTHASFEEDSYTGSGEEFSKKSTIERYNMK